MDQGNRDFKAPMVLMEASEAFSCWYNVKVVLHRLFLMTPQFAMKWDQVVINLQMLILQSPDEFPLLSSHGIVFEMLNLLARGFFNQICQPLVTVQEVQDALDDLFIDPESKWFNSVYTAVERRNSRKRQDPSPPVSTSDGGERVTKKAKAAKAAKTESKDVTGAPAKTQACYNFNSTAGCSDAQCRFHHEPITSKKSRATVKKALQKLKLEPDLAKLE
jgi:hypothetical protein